MQVSLDRFPSFKALASLEHKALRVRVGMEKYLEAMEEGLTAGSQELLKTGGSTRTTVAKFYQGYADFLGMIRGTMQPELKPEYRQPLEGHKTSELKDRKKTPSAKRKEPREKPKTESENV